MKVTKKKAGILQAAIDEGAAENVISQSQAKTLSESYEVIGFDWKRLARYSFWISIICIIISVGAIVADEYLRKLLADIFNE